MTTNLALKTNSIPELSGVFAPVAQNDIEALLFQHKAAKKAIVETMAMLNQPSAQHGLRYLLRAGAYDPHRAHVDPSKLSGLGEEERAIQILDADYWDKALGLTDVMRFMPAEKRQQWRDDINKLNTPAFTEEAVYHTLRQLLLERQNYLAERVDGAFKSLSGEHVTNRPEGFYKRMIFNAADSRYGFCRYKTDTVHDLRFVIALFMERDFTKGHYTTSRLIDYLHEERPGEWHELDGGALRIKVFKKRTVHLEVHDDIAWRLNEILSVLHPKAIPAEFRRKKAYKKEKVEREDTVLMQSLIVPEVLDVLMDIKPAYEKVGAAYRPIENGVTIPFSTDKHLRRAVIDVLMACGGTAVGYYDSNTFKFDYNWYDHIRMEIIGTGALPEKYSHQYYPTPDALAQRLVELADINDSDTVLEPSAGQGSLVMAINRPAQTVCVEVSDLHCKIIKSKAPEATVIQRDFLTWLPAAGQSFDKIVMNPPFSNGRALLHVRRAHSMLAPKGQLVALVPASAGRVLESENGFELVELLDKDSFPGVSIDLALVASKRQS